MAQRVTYKWKLFIEFSTFIACSYCYYKWKLPTIIVLKIHSYVRMYTFHQLCTGGVIEDNEVFGNKFDGICLATGVNPRLKGEQ